MTERAVSQAGLAGSRRYRALRRDNPVVASLPDNLLPRNDYRLPCWEHFCIGRAAKLIELTVSVSKYRLISIDREPSQIFPRANR